MGKLPSEARAPDLLALVCATLGICREITGADGGGDAWVAPYACEDTRTEAA